jgi:hypothetical protein
MVLAAASCQPNYVSGKTQCSDKGECPSGYTCTAQGTGPRVCVAASGVVSGGGSRDAGAGGTGGKPGGGTGGVVATGGSRDAGVGGCATNASCASGQQCFQGQCCPTPAAGGVCNHYPSCGCSAGSVCYPSSTSHAMACFTSDGLGAGEDCSGGKTCKGGYGCFGSICKAYCLVDTDCTSIHGSATCDQTSWSSDKSSIAGVKVCERICDPAHPQSPVAPLLTCPAGFNCSSDSTGISFCVKATPLPLGSTCASEADCPSGYFCSSGNSICKRYCLSNTDCPSGATCSFGFSPAQYAADVPVGFCG